MLIKNLFALVRICLTYFVNKEECKFLKEDGIEKQQRYNMIGSFEVSSVLLGLLTVGR